MDCWAEDRPVYRGREDLAQFESLNTPLWVFDVDRHAMWWGNSSALTFWRVESLDALLARDFSSDSQVVRTRLRQMVDRPMGLSRIQENWTLYPDESPTSVIANIQPVLIEDGRHAIMIEVTLALDLQKDPEALRILEAARTSALMVSSFTMSGRLLSQNPASHACYAQMVADSDHCNLADRFTDETISASILAAVEQEGHFEAEAAVHTAMGRRVHRIEARKGRDPVTGEFITVLNEEDMTEQAALRLDLQRLNNELEARVAERTGSVQAANESLVREIQERQAAEEKLRRAQRMEAVGQLTGGVAHDFNNLLAIIMGNAELLEDERGREDHMVAAILHAATRGSELTQRLLAFSRRQSLRPRPVDVGGQVSGMTDLLRPTLGATIAIETRAAPDQWAALADAGQIESALLNLALNARDAMPGGGRLTIECANVHMAASDVAIHEEMAPGDYVVLSVRDTGTGMSDDVQARAFEPFFTTKDVGQGSGLGLSMVYGFAKQSGGQASITSAEGQGTTVKIYLPRAEETSGTEAAHIDADVPRGRRETILVIEDDADILGFAINVLNGLGYRVIEARDAARARALIAADTAVDLVLSDVVLPGGVSGLEFGKYVRATYPDTKVVFMSGYPPDAAGGGGIPDSGLILLTKPFRNAQLARALRQALD